MAKSSAKKSALQQLSDEEARKATNPVSMRQTLADQSNRPEFEANHQRLKAERLARDAAAEEDKK